MGASNLRVSMDNIPILSDRDAAMVHEFISSLSAILEGRDPHDEIYKQAHMGDVTWTDSAE